jgi:hypothetical protein
MCVFGSGSDVVEYSHARIANGSAPFGISPIVEVIGVCLSWRRILKIVECSAAFWRTAGSVLE